MAKSHFMDRFHDLKYFEVGFYFFIFLQFIINLRALSQKKIVEKHQCNAILSSFKHALIRQLCVQ